MSERLKGNLRRRVSAAAGELTKLAKAFAPNHVRSAISTRTDDDGNGKYIITITANTRKVPDAAAWELGSGIHAKRRTKKKYPIRPKAKKVLAFFWEVADANPENFSFLPDGRVMLASVQHPGIQAANQGQGYIAPAIKEWRKYIKDRLDDDVRDAIRSDLHRSFGKK